MKCLNEKSKTKELVSEHNIRFNQTNLASSDCNELLFDYLTCK